jgi:hypothetical protein
MATTALTMLFKGKKQIGSLVIDVFMVENHNSKATATNFPVEDGSFISDHIFRENDTVDVKGVFCSPIYLFDVMKGTGAYMKAQYAELEALVGTVVTLVTGLRVYDNVSFIDLAITREAQGGRSLEFSAKFQQFGVVKTQSTAMPKSKLGGSSAAQKQAQAPANAGKATPAKPSFLDQKRTEMGILTGK